MSDIEKEISELNDQIKFHQSYVNHFEERVDELKKSKNGFRYKLAKILCESSVLVYYPNTEPEYIKKQFVKEENKWLEQADKFMKLLKENILSSTTINKIIPRVHTFMIAKGMGKRGTWEEMVVSDSHHLISAILDAILEEISE